VGAPATWDTKGGAPKGNSNALKHGHTTGANRRFAAGVRRQIAYANALLRIAEALEAGAPFDLARRKEIEQMLDDLPALEGLEPPP
jgi:hypothetical protein